MESGLEKGDNTKQCRDFCDVERTRAIGKSWNSQEIDSEDYRTLRIEMCSRARSHMISSGDNERNQTYFLYLEEKTQWEKVVDLLIFRKDWSGQSSQLSLEASAYRIQTDVNCQIAVSNFQVNTSQLSPFPWKLCGYFAPGRYCRLSFYTFDRSFEISLIYLIWYHMREIWKISNNKTWVIEYRVAYCKQISLGFFRFSSYTNNFTSKSNKKIIDLKTTLIET